MPPGPWIDLAVNMQITKSIEKHNVFCLLAIFAALSVCFRRFWKGHSPRQTYMQHVARVSKNIAPERFEPPTGRPWSGHVDRSSHFLFSFRFLCEFCTLQWPICHDLAPVMASGKPLDRSRRPSSLKLHAQLASLDLRMPMTESKGGGVALPRGPSIE